MRASDGTIGRVAIFGYFGAGNLGDEAVVDVVIHAIRSRWPDARIDAICLNPEAAAREHGVSAFPLRRMGRENSSPTAVLPFARRLIRRLSRIAPSELLFLAQAYRWLRGTDLVVVGGSGQLIDDEGGPWNHPYNHWKWVLIARCVGARFSFLSVGAGPINTPTGKFLIRQSLQWAEHVSFRDEFSRTLALSIGVRRPMAIYPDQAFGIRSVASQDSRNASGPVIGIAPMAYCDPRHWSTHDSTAYSRYLTRIAGVVVGLVREGKSILLFHTQVNGDDRSIPDVMEMATPLLTHAERESVSVSSVASPSDALRAIMQTDVVIASRFHAILFALSLKKPVVGISYHQKVVDLMKAFGQGDFAVPIDTFESQDVLERAAKVAEMKGSVLVNITARLQAQRDLLEEQYDLVLGKGGKSC